MAPPNRTHQLKVDCTAVRQQHNQYVVIYNINLPRDIVRDPTQRLDALQRVRALLISDFSGVNNLSFQITGTYTLRHSETNEVKDWVGSFSTQINNPSVISQFQLFNRQTFVNTVFQILNTAEAQLLYNGRNSKWKFEELQSIIINVNCNVDGKHPVLKKRRLVRRKIRFRNTFALP